MEILKNCDYGILSTTCILPEQFSTNYESVIIFGKATEVFDNEKNLSFLEILNKYSPSFIDKGKVYIANSENRTKVIKINIEHITGKSRRN